MIRAFIAIHLPLEIKTQIEQSLAPLKRESAGRCVRWVDARLLHLTLKFLGDVQEKQVEALSGRIGEVAAAAEPFEFHVQDFGVFPGLRKPRVLWVGLHERSGALQSLQRSLERELESVGFKPERRAFHPHVTVGRVRRRAAESEIQRLVPLLEGFHVESLGTLLVEQIHLVRSDLTPEGPIYSNLVEYPLGVRER